MVRDLRLLACVCGSTAQDNAYIDVSLHTALTPPHVVVPHHAAGLVVIRDAVQRGEFDDNLEKHSKEIRKNFNRG